MSATIVLVESLGPVARVTLNRPEKRNALSRALIGALSDALSGLATTPGLRALVLAANGPAFCAGLDLKEAEEFGRDAAAEQLAIADMQAFSDVIAQIHNLPVATVAALNGDAFAGGAGLVTACDLVVASSHARLAWPEVKRGLVAAVILPDLLRQAGERRARELLLTGEPIDAARAEQWGLVNRVMEPEFVADEALALARSLALGAPQALATIKRLIAGASGPPADLRGAAAVSAAVRVSEEAAEGMRAFLEKRPPRWAAGPDE
jgi:methylglutaconyl-CoA hydratase